MNSLGKEPLTDDVFTFGKYKGRLVSDIIKENPKYVLWACQNVKFFKINADLMKDLCYRVNRIYDGYERRYDSLDYIGQEVFNQIY